MRKLIILVSLFFSNPLFGQDISQEQALNYRTITPSPSVVSFLKQGSATNSEYTGTANYTINLFEFKTRDFQFPINLSYSTNGLNVNNHSSWVGNGWNVSGLGMIGRTINDLEDESSLGRFSNYVINNLFDTLGNSRANELIVESFNNDFCQFINHLAFNQEHVQSPDLAWKGSWIDTEPDIYNFRLPTGHSGSFVRNQQGKFFTLDKDEIIVDLIGSFNNVFQLRLIDSRGNEFYFQSSQNQEKTQSTSNCDGNVSQLYNTPKTTAWFLDRIQTSEGTVEFEYEDETIYYDTDINSEYLYIIESSGAQELDGYYNPISNCLDNRISYTKRIKKIIGFGYTIDFIVDSNSRTDLVGSHALKKIVIQSETDTLKVINFYNSYMNSNQFLKLDSLQIIGKNNTELKPYVFRYFGEESNFAGLNKNTFAQDWWGFYNGQEDNNNKRNHPELFLSHYAIPIDNNKLRYYQGAIKDPNFESAKMGSLKTIKLPFGGYEEFEYESNSYFHSVQNGFSQVEFLKSERNVKEFGGSNGGIITISGKRFDIDTYNFVAVTHLVTCSEEAQGIPRNCGAVQIRNLTTNQVIYTLVESGSTALLALEPGTYKVETGVDPEYGSSAIKLEWYNYNTDTLKEDFGGGIRVKAITTFSKNGVQANKHHYSYKNDDGISSGILHSPPIGYYIKTYVSGRWINRQCESGGQFINFITLTNRLNDNPFMGAGNSVVGYSKVKKEYIGLQNINNGIEERHYTNYVSMRHFNNSVSNVPVLDYTNLNGKVLKEELYKSDLTIKERTIFKYSNYLGNSTEFFVSGFKFEKNLNINCPTCELIPFTYFYSKNYSLQTEVIKEFFSGEEISRDTTRFIYIDFEGFKFLKKQTNNFTKGNVYSKKEIEYFYHFESDFLHNGVINSGQYFQPFAATSRTGNTVTDGYYLEKVLVNPLVKYKIQNVYRFNPSDHQTRYLISKDLVSNINNFEKLVEFDYRSDGKINFEYDAVKGTYRQFKYQDIGYNLLPQIVYEGSTLQPYYFNSFENSIGSSNNVNAVHGKSIQNIANCSDRGTISGQANLDFCSLNLNLPQGNYNISYYYKQNLEDSWQIKHLDVWLDMNQSFVIPQAIGFIDALKITPEGSFVQIYDNIHGVGLKSHLDINHKLTKYSFDDLNQLIEISNYKNNLLNFYKYSFVK